MGQSTLKVSVYWSIRANNGISTTMWWRDKYKIFSCYLVLDTHFGGWVFMRPYILSITCVSLNLSICRKQHWPRLSYFYKQLKVYLDHVVFPYIFKFILSLLKAWSLIPEMWTRITTKQKANKQKYPKQSTTTESFKTIATTNLS